MNLGRVASLWGIAVLLGLLPCISYAEDAFDGTVKIGVLNDMSSLYQASTGPGSLLATNMAVEDYLAANPNTKLKPVVLSADHQNKPDTAVSIAREWFDREGVDLVLDVPTSSVALAIADVVVQANKAYINTSAGTARLTGDLCNANTIHWNFDNYALANVTGRAIVQTGGDTWFFVTADYAFGHDLEAQTETVVKEMGGKVLGAVRHPLNTSDFSSFLLQAQASGAHVIALANAGGDTINSIKQAVEFGITARQKVAALLAFVTDIHSLGLPTAQGLLYTQAFYWDLNDSTRAWSKRFFERHHAEPTSNQAANYSATIHFLKAAEAARTHDGRKLVDQMKALPTDDVLFGKGSIREDGRKLHPMYLFQVKTPAESHSEWDVAKLVETVPADKAFRPLSAGNCPLVAKK
ncbi:MAG: ABC transporter substrate-binding protein [Alphaproteobacteria bacterium]|nr:ABC transporter substrate-binding protein [Alphaproteobacteria bacterium]